MQILSRFLLSSLVAVVLSVLLAGMAFAHTLLPMPPINGCGHGVACMYTDDGYGSGSPQHRWYQYGCINLSNEYGDRYIFNNQTGGATVTLYTGSNCNRSQTTIHAGNTWEGNITPINSISLNP